MQSLNTRDVAAVTMFAALWGVINSIFAPVVFSIIGLPILCDLIGFAVLALTVWWISKFGTATIVGLIATAINFVFNPGGFHFLGFTAASMVFDVTIRLIGYDNCFRNSTFTAVSVLSVSALSAGVAGLIIGGFFMQAAALARWAGILGWAGLHMIGGILGAFIGVLLITGLNARSVREIAVKP